MYIIIHISTKNVSKRTKNTRPHEDLYSNVHSSFIRNSPKLKTTQMSINWRMDKQIPKQWYIHTIEYHSPIKGNELVIPARAWMRMNLKSITLNKGRHTKQAMYCWIPFTGYLTNGTTRVTESRSGGWLGLKWKRGINVKRHKRTFRGDRNVPWPDWGSDKTLYIICQNSLNCIKNYESNEILPYLQANKLAC